MKRALRKSSATSDEESLPIVDGDGTDVEFHESLPEDKPKVKHVKVKPNLDSSKHDVKKSANKKDRNSHHHHHHHHHHNQRRQSSEHRTKSSSISSAKDQEDSLKSVWSDNIPVICISKTDSSEGIEKPTFSGNDDVTEEIEAVHRSAERFDDPESQRKIVQAILEESKLWKSKRDADDQNGVEMTIWDKKEKKSIGRDKNKESEVTT